MVGFSATFRHHESLVHVQAHLAFVKHHHLGQNQVFIFAKRAWVQKQHYFTTSRLAKPSRLDVAFALLTSACWRYSNKRKASLCRAYSFYFSSIFSSCSSLSTRSTKTRSTKTRSTKRPGSFNRINIAVDFGSKSRVVDLHACKLIKLGVKRFGVLYMSRHQNSYDH